MSNAPKLLEMIDITKRVCSLPESLTSFEGRIRDSASSLALELYLGLEMVIAFHILCLLFTRTSKSVTLTKVPSSSVHSFPGSASESWKQDVSQRKTSNIIHVKISPRNGEEPREQPCTSQGVQHFCRYLHYVVSFVPCLIKRRTSIVAGGSKVRQHTVHCSDLF